MIIVYGAIATLLTELIKWLSGKIGKELAGPLVLVVVFVLCLIWALIDHWAKIAVPGFWEMFIGSAVSAIAIYEVIIKRIWRLVVK